MSARVPRQAALESIAVIEIESIARGFVALDAIAKRAPVTVRIARAVSPGKLVIVFGGDVESVLESFGAAREAAGSALLDELLLPGAHPGLLPAIERAIAPTAGEAVGIAELRTVASTVQAADVALKATAVDVVRMHLAVDIGGKGWFTLAGPLGDVQAAIEAVRDAVGEDRVVALEVIAQPHGEVRGFMS